MKKALIIYFTGTYNTRFLVQEFAKRLEKNEYNVNFTEVKEGTEVVQLNDYDLITISYPIYAFNIPSFFMKYLKKIKYLNNKKYLILKQSGEPLPLNNASSRKLIRIFRKNKITNYSEYHFLLPYNIHFRFEDEFSRELLYSNEKLFDIVLEELKQGQNTQIKSNIFYNLNAWMLSIQGIGGKINSFLYKVDENKCIKCNKCVKICPVNNIYIKDGKIKFHHKCLMCMRCSMFCPKDAFSIGFINSWKVNGPYNLEKMNNEKSENDQFVIKHKDEFYKIYIEYLEKIKEKHKYYFNN